MKCFRLSITVKVVLHDHRLKTRAKSQLHSVCHSKHRKQRTKSITGRTSLSSSHSSKRLSIVRCKCQHSRNQLSRRKDASERGEDGCYTHHKLLVVMNMRDSSRVRVKTLEVAGAISRHSQFTHGQGEGAVRWLHCSRAIHNRKLKEELV